MERVKSEIEKKLYNYKAMLKRAEPGSEDFYCCRARIAAYEELLVVIKQILANSAKNCKVESKFKVGDFVLHGKKNIIFQVEKTFLDGTYRIVPIDADKGKAVTGATEDTLRLWTIQDAKDGDVLVNEYGSVFIYAGFEDDERVTVDNYCYITANHDEFFIEDHKTGSWYYVKELNPATKEQRDLLFQKMREAGYEWDAEKKELRKIEQKNVWSEEDDKMLQGTIDSLRRYQLSMPNFQVELQMRWLSSFKNRYTWKPSDKGFKVGDKVLITCKKQRDANFIYDGKVGEVTHIWDLKRNPWGNIGVTLPDGCNNGFLAEELEVVNN